MHAGNHFVDFFFVLSGFVIAATYGARLSGGYSPSRFLWLRLGRVYPAHFVMVACYFAIECAVALSAATGITGREAFTGPRDLAYLPVVLVLAQALWPDATMTWAVQSWSISVEFMLYLAVAFGWRRMGGGWWLGWLALALLAAAIVASGVLAPWTRLLRGFCGFGLGVVCWKLWLHLGPRLKAMPRWPATLAEAALVAACCWIFATAADPVPLLASNLVFALAVLVFAAERGGLSRVLVTGPFLLAGVLSYSVYMVHALVETAFLRVAQAVLGALGRADLFAPDATTARPVPTGGWEADLLCLATLGVVIAVSWAFHRWFEWPAREWSRRVAPAIGQKPAGLRS